MPTIPAIVTQHLAAENLSATQAILLAVGLTIAMFLLTATSIGINAVFCKRDKQRAVRWLESRGCRVQKIEWALYPAKSIWLTLQRYSAFDVHYVDSIGANHHATVAVPMWSSAQFVADDITD